MRIGIIGTGRIASRFAETALTGIRSASINCVYNPNIESAQRFCVAHNLKCYTNNLEAFLDNIDAAYIASPHETHY